MKTELVTRRTLNLAPEVGETVPEYLARIAMMCDDVPMSAIFSGYDDNYAYLHWSPYAEGGVAARGSVSPSNDFGLRSVHGH